MHLQGLWEYGDENWESILDLRPQDKGHISESNCRYSDGVLCSFALHVLFFSQMYGCMNISIICTPQVLDWTVYLWLRHCVVKNRKGQRVSPRTWLRSFYTTWSNQAVSKHAMDINSSPPHRTYNSASWQHLATAQLPAAALLSCSLMNSWAFLSQDCNRSAHVHQQA